MGIIKLNGWHRVSDTMPKKKGMYLILEDGDYYLSYYYTKDVTRKGVKQTQHHFSDPHDNQDYDFNPQYWRELPELPTEI